MTPVLYKARGIIRSCMWGDHMIPYKIRGTIRVTDRYKVPTVDSNHIVHVGSWHVLAPKDWGL